MSELESFLSTALVNTVLIAIALILLAGFF